MATNDAEDWLNSLSDAELRQMAENWNESMEPILRQIASAPTGHFDCPRCSMTGEWTREGSNWSAWCENCNWNSAGRMNPAAIAKN